MNYINKDKNYMTDAERIRYLEESIRELKKEKENLKKEKGEIRQRLIKLQESQAKLIRVSENKELREENKLLERAINELMIQCDIKYFRFRDKEFYKQESPLSFISDKN